MKRPPKKKPPKPIPLPVPQPTPKDSDSELVGGIDSASMLLRFVTEDEQQKLVAAWPMVGRRKFDLAMLRQWCGIAGIMVVPRVKTYARSLLRSGVCREDGTVHPKVAEALSLAMLDKVLGRKTR